MKDIVHKVDPTLYDELMKNLTEGLEPTRPASPLIDEGDEGKPMPQFDPPGTNMQVTAGDDQAGPLHSPKTVSGHAP